MRQGHPDFREDMAGESLTSLLETLKSPNPATKVSTLLKIAKVGRHQDWFVDQIVREAEDPSNEARDMGWRVADIAVYCLIELDTQVALDAALTILARWPKIDRSILLKGAHRLDLI